MTARAQIVAYTNRIIATRNAYHLHRLAQEGLCVTCEQPRGSAHRECATCREKRKGKK
jgi:hypothetical protein